MSCSGATVERRCTVVLDDVLVQDMDVEERITTPPASPAVQSNSWQCSQDSNATQGSEQITLEDLIGERPSSELNLIYSEDSTEVPESYRRRSTSNSSSDVLVRDVRSRAAKTDALARDVRIRAAKSVARSYPCRFCDEANDNLYDSMMHTATHLTISITRLDLYQCEKCVTHYVSPIDLLEHTAVMHPDIISPDEISPDTSKQTSDSSSKIAKKRASRMSTIDSKDKRSESKPMLPKKRNGYEGSPKNIGSKLLADIQNNVDRDCIKTIKEPIQNGVSKNEHSSRYEDIFTQYTVPNKVKIVILEDAVSFCSSLSDNDVKPLSLFRDADNKPLSSLLGDTDNQPLSSLLGDSDDKPLSSFLRDIDDKPLSSLLPNEDEDTPLSTMVPHDNFKPIKTLAEDDDGPLIATLADADDIPLSTLLTDPDDKSICSIATDGDDKPLSAMLTDDDDPLGISIHNNDEKPLSSLLNGDAKSISSISIDADEIPLSTLLNEADDVSVDADEKPLSAMLTNGDVISLSSVGSDVDEKPLSAMLNDVNHKCPSPATSVDDEGPLNLWLSDNDNDEPLSHMKIDIEDADIKSLSLISSNAENAPLSSMFALDEMQPDLSTVKVIDDDEDDEGGDCESSDPGYCALMKPGVHPCLRCEQVFWNRFTMVCHNVVHLRIPLTAKFQLKQKEAQFICHDCGQVFYKKISIVMHQMGKHLGRRSRIEKDKGKIKNLPDNLAKLVMNARQEIRFTNICRLCRKTYTCWSSHAAECTPQFNPVFTNKCPTVQCQQCGKVISKQFLARHINFYHQPFRVCEVCSLLLKDASLCKYVPRGSFTPEVGTVPCDACGKQFLELYEYRRVQRMKQLGKQTDRFRYEDEPPKSKARVKMCKNTERLMKMQKRLKNLKRLK